MIVGTGSPIAEQLTVTFWRRNTPFEIGGFSLNVGRTRMGKDSVYNSVFVMLLLLYFHVSIVASFFLLSFTFASYFHR